MHRMVTQSMGRASTGGLEGPEQQALLGWCLTEAVSLVHVTFSSGRGWGTVEDGRFRESISEGGREFWFSSHVSSSNPLITIINCESIGITR